jgi:hypothetical protein
MMREGNTNSIRPMLRTVIVTLMLVLSLAATGQERSLLSFIATDSAIDVQLLIDWRTLHKSKSTRAYQPAELVIQPTQGAELKLKGKVRVRGRHRLDICSFPPIKLKLDKSSLTRHGFSELNEFDIVHRCQSGDQYEQFILRELLAYKLYELISPVHLKSQLIRLHYSYPDGTKAHQSSYAFLVEDKEELVSRLGARHYKPSLVSRGAIDRMELLRVALFQFMIGNTDWYILNRHNLEFVGIPGHNLLVPIPYDFDYSGLVDATYAAHHESLEVQDVTIRYYQGWCHSEEEVEAALQVFREQKLRMLALPETILGLNERSVKHAVNFLNGFYSVIENPQKLRNQIIRHCDMWPVQP